MDTFDYVIVAVGVALIIIGLVLFIAGKRDTQHANQVEGFGIKLNVSNPSIILIIFGIGLVLFPRLMPNAKLLPSTAVVNPTETQVSVMPNKNGPQTVTPTVSSNKIAAPQTRTDMDMDQTANRPTPANVFFPRGRWYLYQYEENGIDLSGTLEGRMLFNDSAGGRLNWSASLMTADFWGNTLNYQYAGLIQFVSGGYLIDTLNSNDPSFVPQGPTNLILKMDNPELLHMEYVFNGSLIVLHLMQ
jgi:hypothetical protein